jgi:ketosteroid isomerase-like protein
VALQSAIVSDELQSSSEKAVPSPNTVERFVARVEENAHVEAVEEFYTENSSMRENQGPPRIGRDAHAANERRMMARTKSLVSKCIRPIFVNGDRVVIRWNFHFEFKDGTTLDMDELAYQRWEGERIAEETFYYDPAQRAPKQAAP